MAKCKALNSIPASGSVSSACRPPALASRSSKTGRQSAGKGGSNEGAFVEGTPLWGWFTGITRGKLGNRRAPPTATCFTNLNESDPPVSALHR